MFDTASRTATAQDGISTRFRAVSRRQVVSAAREHWAIVAVLGLAGFLYVYRLDQNGYANTYYSGAVLSMSKSWSAFFFGSVDTSNFITVDKPPAALWVQALSVRAFGFSSWSLLLPEALAGVASVGLLYVIVKRAWGGLAGVIAALALAVTPITAATVRENLPDSVLVLTMLGAAWCGLRATEKGSWRRAVASGVLVGVAFNEKMLQAFIMLPALALVFVVAAPVSWRTRAMYLGAATAALAVVSGSWMVIVDSLPGDMKPYIGGSTDGTVRDLVLGYNGLGRITGDENGPGSGGNARPADGNDGGQFTDGANRAVPGDGGLQPRFDGTGAADDGRPAGPVPGGQLPGQPGPNGGAPGGPGGFGGEPGWLRLMNTQLGTQIAWLVPLALGGAAIAFLARGRAGRTDRKRAWVIFWSAYTATHIVVFSRAQGIMHPYYTSALAPGVAALVGIGVAGFIEAAKRWKWSVLALVPLLAAAIGVQLELIGRASSGWNGWLAPVMVAGTTGFGLVFVTAHLVPWRRWAPVLRVVRPVSTTGVAGALMVAPMLWSFSVLDGPGSGGGPSANPSNSNGDLRAQGPGGPIGPALSSSLLGYLEANRGEAKWMVAVQSAQLASSVIIASDGEPVMGMGGFTGSDPAPAVDELKTMIADGEIRFFLLGGNGGAPGGSNSAATAYVTSTCSVVDGRQYGGPATGTSQTATDGGFRPGGAQVLYDCAVAR